MILEGNITIPYKWTTGYVVGRFLAELRDNARIVGGRCDGCGKVYVPPPEVCGECFKPLCNWVNLSGEGTVVASSTVHRQMPLTSIEPPYTLALVKLDGADTEILHLAREGVSTGDRVRACFKQEREGSLLDIQYFIQAGEQEPSCAGEEKAAVEDGLEAQITVKEVRGRVVIPYRWSYGEALTRFFEESRDNRRLVGTRCPRCKSVIVPAARICTRCYEETKEWVEVSDRGVLESFTTVHLPFPGQPTEPPYTYGIITLDGASTYFSHLINEPPELLRCGMRVRAVWSDDRKGDLFDILYFVREEDT